MSTPVPVNRIPNIRPNFIGKLNKKMEKKSPLNRSTSIETIKRINMYICSPQSYFLPAILTTWLKTGQKSFHSSAEKTIFLFRSLIFGVFLFKFLLKSEKSFTDNNGKIDLQIVFSEIFSKLYQQFSIRFYFIGAIILLTIEMCLSFYFIINSVIVPLGLIFLMFSLAFIVILGHLLNNSYLLKLKKYI